MKMIVCVKQVPGTSKVKVDETTGVLIRSGIDTKMNPYDLYAVETGVQIKEQTGGELCAVTMGPPQAVDVLREAFMMGVDEGVLLTDRKFAGADCLATSYALSQAILALGLPDLILCGKQTTDGDTAQVGPELAEFLQIPHIANVRRIVTVGEHSLTAEVDLPDQIQTVEIPYPCLISVEKGIFQPRLPSYKLKQLTRERAVKTLTLKDLSDTDEKNYGLNGSPTRVVRIFPPEANTHNETWQNSGAELAERLFDLLAEKKLLSKEASHGRYTHSS